MTSSPFQPGMEGPRSSATVPKEERILSKEGLEDKEERDSHAPEQGCISCGILLSGTGARGVSSEHMENMEMFSCSPT